MWYLPSKGGKMALSDDHRDAGFIIPRLTKHPEVSSVVDVVTFRIARLTAINTCAGQHWMERMFDLGLNEWWLLAVAHAHDSMRAGDMAELLVMDKSQLSRLIKVLIGKALIKSEPDVQDARATIISVTPKGHMVNERILQEVLHRNESVLAPLSVAEVDQLNDLLALAAFAQRRDIFFKETRWPSHL